jgi:hypothetical protein
MLRKACTVLFGCILAHGPKADFVLKLVPRAESLDSVITLYAVRTYRACYFIHTAVAGSGNLNCRASRFLNEIYRFTSTISAHCASYAILKQTVADFVLFF